MNRENFELDTLIVIEKYMNATHILWVGSISFLKVANVKGNYMANRAYEM